MLHPIQKRDLRIFAQPRIVEGQIMNVCGYHFIATEVEYFTDDECDDCEILRYIGICTDESRNDSIRNTGYNGGTYGYRVLKNEGAK